MAEDIWALLSRINAQHDKPTATTPGGQGNSDVAQYLLNHTLGGSTQWSKPVMAGKKDEGRSLLTSIFDTLAIPGYAVSDVVSNTIDDIKEGGVSLAELGPKAALGLVKHTPSALGGAALRSLDNTVDIAAGLTGTYAVMGDDNFIEKGFNKLGETADEIAPRKSWQNILHDQLGVDNKVARYGGGFALDVLTDPLNLVPGVAGAKAARTAAGATEKALAQGLNDIPLGSAPSAVAQSPAEQLAARAASEGKVTLPTPNPELPFRTNALKTQTTENITQGLPNFDTAISQTITPQPIKGAERLQLPGLESELRMQRAAQMDAINDAKAAEKGKITYGDGKFSATGVQRVVEGIADGNTARTGPPIIAAVGKDAEDAIEVANQIAANLTKKTRNGRSVKELTPADQANLFNSLWVRSQDVITEAVNAKRATAKVSPKAQNVLDELATSDEPVEAIIARYGLNKTETKQVQRALSPVEPLKAAGTVKRLQPKVRALQLSKLRAAEDDLIRQGIEPVHWTGMRMRLSDVIAEVGVKALDDSYVTRLIDAMKDPKKLDALGPEGKAAIETVLARRASTMSDLLVGLTARAGELKNVAQNYPVADRILKGLPKQAGDAAQAAGMTAKEIGALDDMIKEAVATPTAKIVERQQAIVKAQGTVLKALEEGKLNAVSAQAFNDALFEATGTVAKGSRTEQSWADMVKLRFSTWHGVEPIMKRIADNLYKSKQEYADARALSLKTAAQKWDGPVRSAGFNLALKGAAVIAKETDPLVREAAEFFSQYITDLFGPQGIGKLDTIEGSLVSKSSMTMKDLNKELAEGYSAFRFRNDKTGKLTLPDGTKIDRDYSANGVGWVKSLELAKFGGKHGDPLVFLRDLDLATQRLTAKYALIDDFAARFGSKTATGVHTTRVNEPRLAGYMFDGEQAQFFNKLMNDIEAGHYKPNSKMMRGLANATRTWKSHVTIYYGAHHVRNMIGDAWNTWASGINDPFIYRDAAKLMGVRRAAYGDAVRDATPSEALKNINALIGKTAPSTPKGSEVLINTRGLNLTTENVIHQMEDRGLFPRFHIQEDLQGDTGLLREGDLAKSDTGSSVKDFALNRLSKPYGSKAYQLASGVSEFQGHYARAAHYIGYVKKHAKKIKGPITEEKKIKLFDEAAAEVRKWHPTGDDLTKTEQMIRSFGIPFYSWTRKEIPLLVQTLVQRPARVNAYPRAQLALSQMLGVNDGEATINDPYPDDQLFPYWVRASGIAPIGDPQSENRFARFLGNMGATIPLVGGGQQGYTMVNPSNPFNDTVSSVAGFGGGQEIVKGLLNMSNPGINIPVAIGTNKTFSGAPIDEKDGGQGVGQYLLSQVPTYGALSRATGIGRDEKSTPVEGQNVQNIINMLLATGIKGTGPYIKQAEFEAKDRARVEAERNK